MEKMTRYAMLIDLNRCTRCRTCYVVCKKEHHIVAHPRDNDHPYEYYRLRYVEWEVGKYPTTRRAFAPLACMHCEDPICAKFCALDAIHRTSDGVVVIDKDTCNGCGVCAAVCPYGALYMNPAEKADGCDFCSERLDKDLLPKCVENCPGRARIFADLEDPESEISKFVASGKAKPLLFEGIERTRVYYVPSPNEQGWDDLPTRQDFQKALTKRKRDLPPVKGIV
jgi:Fe-S-cluster-containing dehydrogenase component